jgi:hypothetical protein
MLGFLSLAMTRIYAQHPIGYSSLHASSQMATFAFDSLDRAILVEKAASFYADEPMSITFEVLVAPDGSVKYVRAPRLGTQFHELRLACTSALYSFAFEPVDLSLGERWFKAKMVMENTD